VSLTWTNSTDLGTVLEMEPAQRKEVRNDSASGEDVVMSDAIPQMSFEHCPPEINITPAPPSQDDTLEFQHQGGFLSVPRKPDLTPQEIRQLRSYFPKSMNI
jgi:hypothetical protein